MTEQSQRKQRQNATADTTIEVYVDMNMYEYYVCRSRDLHTAERTRVLALRLPRLRRNLSYVITGRRRSEPDDWTHRMLMDFSICIDACVYDTRRLFGS